MGMYGGPELVGRELGIGVGEDHGMAALSLASHQRDPWRRNEPLMKIRRGLLPVNASA